MCKYCNGDLETQEPIKEVSTDDCNPVLTIISSKDLYHESVLSVIPIQYPPKEILYHINFCPMCGREL